MLSRRNFCWTAGTAALGTGILHRCQFQPVDQAPLSQSHLASPKPDAVSPGIGAGPETTAIRLGYIPVVGAAPLIVAQERGFFAHHGMTDVQLRRQLSWGAAKDNVTIGGEGGGIEGGQWPMPMPYYLSEGLITNGNQRIPMYTLLQLVTQGNGIAIAHQHANQGIQLHLSQATDYLWHLKQSGQSFIAAHTFPMVSQALWLRYWLGAAGIDPDRDVKLLSIPPVQTVANMRVGTVDAFSASDPWPSRIVDDHIGFLGLLTAELWPYHPEEFLAIRADWVDRHPKATVALVKAILEAQQWCDHPDHRQELAELLSQRQFLNLPDDLLLAPLTGLYKTGMNRSAMHRFTAGPLYWTCERGVVSYPYKSLERWFLTEALRWGFWPESRDITLAIRRVNRDDIWLEAFKGLAITGIDIPTQSSRGLEVFFDGVVFDPANPTAYLKSLKIKRVRLS